MSYYLGKVGRAGAHILSSCKDLYNDVNAAYLTGAVDIIVVKQKDGSLKSTPFHVRFGKLGVLRTGDLKEVEVEINGKPVDLHMKIDETGRGFFSKRKDSETATESDSSDNLHIALDIDSLLTRSLSESHMTQPTPLEYSASASTSSTTIEDVSTPVYETIVKQNSDTFLLSSQTTLSDKSLASDYHKWRSASLTGDGLVNRPPVTIGCIRDISGGDGLSGNVEMSEQPISFSAPRKSTPISIDRFSSDGLGSRAGLPVDSGVLSDSALERDRSDSVPSRSTLSALSDTEVEVQDRLSSKLWEWSASAKRKRQTSLGEPSVQVSTLLSEDELKERLQPQPATVDSTGFWSTLAGMLKRRNRHRYSSMEDGIYLEDIDYESMDPEELSKFFPSYSNATEAPDVTSVADQTCSSGLGSSPTLSPSQSSYEIQKEDNSKLVSTLDDCAFSLCGGLGQGNITEEQFQNSQVSYPDLCTDPCSVFSNPNLVVRVNGKYYNWQTASALVMSAVAFLRVLPEQSQEKINKKYMPKKVQTRQSFWNFWGRGKSIDDDSNIQDRAKSEGSSPIGSPRKWEHPEGRGRSDTGDSMRAAADILSSDDEQEATKVPIRPRQRSLRKRKSGFTTSLSSEELASLSLKSGANNVVFSITTKYQGTTKAQCTLYLWNYFDKIVVSDIDGTITRSDVAGQVLPLLGKDWTQNGVVELFSSVTKNSYRIMYLSARAIGQAGYTKEFLRNVKRGTSSLPDGPLFLAPFSLYKAFKKEVIEKKPEEFKIDCLKQIRDLFPVDYNPFHAGFGNKSSDVKSYVQVDIPQSRIFTVNHKGHLKHELSISFQSNYMDLMGFVDAQFPPLKYSISETEETDSVPVHETDIEASNIKEDFNMFNYWRDPMGLVLPYDLPELT